MLWGIRQVITELGRGFSTPSSEQADPKMQAADKGMLLGAGVVEQENSKQLPGGLRFVTTALQKRGCCTDRGQRNPFETG